MLPTTGAWGGSPESISASCALPPASFCVPRTAVPTSVVIDEAIEIARRYGGEESSQFVNGILDQIAGRLGVRERRESPKPAEP